MQLIIFTNRYPSVTYLFNFFRFLNNIAFNKHFSLNIKRSGFALLAKKRNAKIKIKMEREYFSISSNADFSTLTYRYKFKKR